jgi:hypothetical protein
VSVIRVSDCIYLIADYARVYLFDRAAGSLAPMSVDMGDLPSGKWVPTGLAVEDASHILIASYLGNSVLRARVDLAAAKLTIEGEIGDADTISPENVSSEGATIAVANYDGGSIQIFDRNAEHKARCTVPLKQAHGVVAIGPFVIATSLLDRTVVKIDLASCAILGKTGSEGWGAGQFLWPTSIGRWDDGRIAVTDAHTGLLSIFDASTLAFERRFGGNGPGENGLNMPYGFDASGPDALMLSTFGQRILIFGRDGTLTESWGLKPAWRDLRDGSAYFLSREQRSPYERRDVEITIGGKCYHPSYWQLASCDGGQNIAVSFGASQAYFLEALAVPEGTLVFSPQTALALVYPNGGGPPKIPQIGFDHWLVDGQVVGPEGRLDVEHLSTI